MCVCAGSSGSSLFRFQWWEGNLTPVMDDMVDNTPRLYMLAHTYTAVPLLQESVFVCKNEGE